MAVIKISNKRSFKQTLNYIGRDHATPDGEKKPAAYTSGILCSDNTTEAVQDFWLIQKSYNKTGGKRSAVEIIQSYPAGEKVTPAQVHQLGLELAKELEKLPYLSGHQMFLATHTDQKHGNLHNHLAINAVSLETGKKIQLPPEALPAIKDINDKICRAHGLSVPEKGRTAKKEEREAPTANKTNTYAVLAAAESDKADSYIRDIAVKVIDVASVATNRADFVARLERQGVGVAWSDNRKYITFEDLKRKKRGEKKYKVRDKKISEYYNLEINKEVLDNGFKINAAKFAAAERARKQLDRAADNSLRAVQSGQQPVTAAVTGTTAGKQQSDGQVSGSLQKDRSLGKLGLGAGESTAAQSERQRRLREQQAAAEKARELAAAKRAEEQRLAEQRAAAEKTAAAAQRSRKKSRSDDWSL
jgi:hypothetical protein